MLSGEGLVAVVGNPRKGRVPPHLRPYLFKKGHGKRRRSRARVHHGKKRRASRAVITVRANPHHSRRRARRNPRFSLPRLGGVGHTISGAAVGASGALALDVLLSYTSSYLPAQLQSGWGLNLARLGGAIGIGYGARFVLPRRMADGAMLGALTVVAYSILKSLLNQYVLPATHQLAGLGDPGAYADSFPGVNINGYRPLGRLGHGGSSGTMAMNGYIRRGAPMPAMARPKTVSGFIPQSGGGRVAGLGADIEL